MQATVFSQDAGSGAQVVTDDGVAYQVSDEVVAASGLRFLRAGQRVSIRLEDAHVTRLWIVGIGEGETIR
ncbi:hypothetical protein GCM10027055_19930 [Janibacter alkaliphilus]|uniref:Cold shock CspA family protein n=1 Tax=Janibacter alkaliphilus TaxID=1069963 RepID=A0A852WZ76_9MICO|nr:hypothetical protein [Janibacter alkaliphilus]NYG35557.1 cold shock CspA family protein [Janibacter alkaliphilus]